MKQHFTEADLLETYYTRPGESLPIMMHLADCSECASRYERLEKKMQSLRSCAHDAKPETFWARQRMAILRKVDERRASSPLPKLAAAAALVLALSGLAFFADRDQQAPARPVVQQQQSAAVDEMPLPATTSAESPWQSEELDEYAGMVDWETWVEDPS
jgi:anti-sigma factor RsiW